MEMTVGYNKGENCGHHQGDKKNRRKAKGIYLYIIILYISHAIYLLAGEAGDIKGFACID